MRGRWIFLFALVAGLGVFASIWIAALPDGDKPVTGGRYVEGIAGAPSRINPLFAELNEADESLVALIFAGLTRLDDRGRPFPDLAEKWTVSADGLTYKFTLRAGLLWPDGTQLTARDVEYTYELLRTLAVGPSSTVASVLAQAVISTLDLRTVVIQLDQPLASLPAYLIVGILPFHLVSDAGPEGISTANFNQAPVGAGPFRLKELDNERAVLVPNPFYHFAQPLLDQIELRFFENEAVLLAALEARQIDGALFRAGLDEADIQDLKQANVHTTAVPTAETVFVFFNLNKPMFEDHRVRQALIYALDRDKIVASVFGRLATRSDSPLTATIWSSTPSLARYAFDIQAAKSLLEEAGWFLVADVRQQGGSSLAFHLATDSDPVRMAVAEEIARSWQVLGIEVTLDLVGGTALVRDLLEARGFEALLFGVSAGPDPDPFSMWHSSSATAQGDNLASLRNVTIDGLLEEGRSSSSVGRREELYIEFQRLFAEEIPSIPLYAPTSIYTQTSSLKGLRIGFLPSQGQRFWQVAEWYLETQ